MTKLDEALKAGREAYWKAAGERDEAFLQAAVKVLVPDERPATQLDGLNIHASGYNACRREILKNAGVE